jgi:hypothetical protein
MKPKRLLRNGDLRPRRQIATDRVSGDARSDLVKRFVAIADKAGISNISEGTPSPIGRKNRAGSHFTRLAQADSATDPA